MELINLNFEDRKKVYKLFEWTKMKKTLSDKNDKLLFLTVFKKGIQQLTKQEIIDYLEENLLEMSYDSKIYELVTRNIIEAINSKTKKTKEIVKKLNKINYSEVNEESVPGLEKFSEDYKKNKFDLSFEDFVLLNCKMVDNRLDEIKNEKKEQEYAKKENEIEELSQKNELLNKEIKELKQALKNEKEQSNKIEKDNNRYRRIMSLENIKFKLSSLFENQKMNKSLSIDELYENLNKLENEAIKENNYSQIKKILAAKYAIIKLAEEEN